MKKLLFIAAAITVSFIACKKHPTSTPATVMYIPWDLDTLMPQLTSVVPQAQISNVDGIFIACNVIGNFHDTAGIVYSYRRSWEIAAFAGTALPTAINGTTLVPDMSPSYLPEPKWTKVNFDSGNVWKEDTANYWIAPVTPSGSPYNSFTVNGTMPLFTGTLPATHDTTTDFHLTFDGSNTVNADSAYVVLYLSGWSAQSPTVRANGGTATIPASAITRHTASHPITGIISEEGGHLFKGNLMAVVLYSCSYQNSGAKRYAFVKQTVVLSYIDYH